ncbi:lipopolysaccharide biosynthesis protein [Geodermatophilus normandii]|uniref:lipopolysaccharide biosynthesis protein n=1 Tax=Geodermatophilus normandii TaxID=1137989 RepID=UPI000D71D7AD|nr:lipopolysaccharide biosynthesis protein [Geodermatophilus normandii]
MSSDRPSTTPDDAAHPVPDELSVASSVAGLAPPTAPSVEDVASTLFGRGMLYVAVLAAQMVSSVLVSPILAHLLPPREFGELASAIAVHQVLVVLAVAGIDQALVQIRATSDDDRPARALVLLALVLACALTAVAALTVPWWGHELGFAPSSPILVTVIGWTVPASATLVVSALLLSQDRLGAFSLLNILSAVGGQFSGLVILIGGGYRTANAYALGGLGSLALVLVLGLVLVRPRWSRRIGPDVARRALALGIPLMVSGLAIYVLNAGDRLVVQRLLGPEEAGRYQIAYTVGNVAVLLLSMVSAAWAPRIAAIADEDRRWALIGHSRDGLIALMAPAITGITLAAPLVLTLVAPESYRPGALLPVVFLVALAGFPVLAGSGTGRALVTLERTGPLAWSAVIAAVVNVGLNILLVPHLDLSGAALATLVAFTIQAVLHRAWLPAGIVWPRTPLAVLLPPTLAVAVCAATLLLPQSTEWDLGRFALAVVCLPWFLHRLRIAQGKPGLLRRPT